MTQPHHHGVRVPHIHGKLCHDNVLHVIGVVSNPVRYQSRYRLFRKWLAEMEATPHVKVYVVEIAFGDREFEIAEENNPAHLQLRTRHELWHKENMINLAVRHLLPRNWKYVSWIDGDVFFPDKSWAMETIQQLQHYHVVQPWTDAIDLGSSGNVLQHFQSFCYIHRLKVPKQTHPSQPYKYAHTGFAWACTRLFWENVGGLMDWCIVGSADHHMAWAMINQVQHSVHQGMTPEFKRKALLWQQAAYWMTKGHLGFVKTRIEHAFHGPKAKRGYRSRWSIFIDHQFDPSADLAYDEQGLLKILDKDAMQQEIHDYNRARDEDSTSDY